MRINMSMTTFTFKSVLMLLILQVSIQASGGSVTTPQETKVMNLKCEALDQEIRELKDDIAEKTKAALQDLNRADQEEKRAAKEERLNHLRTLETLGAKNQLVTTTTPLASGLPESKGKEKSNWLDKVFQLLQVSAEIKTHVSKLFQNNLIGNILKRADRFREQVARVEKEVRELKVQLSNKQKEIKNLRAECAQPEKAVAKKDKVEPVVSEDISLHPQQVNIEFKGFGVDRRPASAFRFISPFSTADNAH